MPVIKATIARQNCFPWQPRPLSRACQKNAECVDNEDDPFMAILETKRSILRQNSLKSSRIIPRQYSGRSVDRAHALANKVFEFSREGIVITDSKNNILSVNRAFTEITGYSADEVVGKKPGFLYSGGENAAAVDGLPEKISAKGYWQGESWGQRKNGDIFPTWLTISAATDKTGKITHYISLFSDITEQKREALRFEYLAFHDALTGLPNRVLFNERLSAAISLAHRHGNALGVLYLDLNGFKQINDTLGHGCGDQLLQQMALRLKQYIRESDAVARLGGDEFAILLTEVSDQRNVEDVAKKILRSLQTPFNLSAQKIVVSASIGIALFPEHGTDNATLLEKADAAMYKAKFGPHGDFQFSFPPLE